MDRHNRGFTLVELMVVVLIMAITLAFGLPAFGEFVTKNRIRTATESVIEAFRVARLTAVKNREEVRMCPYTSGTPCTSSVDWQKGIMIVDKNDQVIYQMQFNPRLHIEKNNEDGSTNDVVNINANGWTPGDQASIYICGEEGDITNGYQIIISMSGRVRAQPITQSDACGTAAG